MKNLFITFTIVVMIFSGFSLVHAQRLQEDTYGILPPDWRVWTEINWRNLTPDQAGSFFSDPEAITTPDGWGVNPLIYASAYSSEDTFIKFLEMEVDVSKKFDNGWTALGSAVIAGNNDVVSELINRGVDIEQPFGEENWMPLVAGIARENVTTVAMLLEAGANLGALQSFDFLTTVDIPQDTNNRARAELLVDAWREVEAGMMLSGINLMLLFVSKDVLNVLF